MRLRRPRAAPPDELSEVRRLVRDVRELRRTLESDLTLAAAAMEVGQTDVARDIVGADSAQVAAVGQKVDRIRLSPPPSPRPAEVKSTAAPARLRWLRTLPAAPTAVAAAALAAVLAGVLPTSTAGPRLDDAAPSLTVATSFAQFDQMLTGRPTAAQVAAAADRLRASLHPLLAAAGQDPGTARQLLQLLQAELGIVQARHPAGAAVLLDELQQLIEYLQSVLATGSPGSLTVSRPAVVGASVPVHASPLPSSYPADRASYPVPGTQPPSQSNRHSGPTPTPAGLTSPTPSSQPSPAPTQMPSILPSGNPTDEP